MNEEASRGIKTPHPHLVGVGCLRSKNLSLLGKWKWRFLTEEHALWRTVIKEFYGDDGGVDSNNIVHRSCGVWTNIVKAVKCIEAVDLNFKNSFIRKVANGATTSFWHDQWSGCQRCMGWIMGLAYSPRGRAIDELNALQITLNSVLLPFNGRDKWFWIYDKYGFFKVKVLSKVIEFLLLGVHSLGSHHKWNSWIPRKVNVMVWKASIDRLATCSNLATRGVILPSPNCPFYASDIEDSKHVLLKCQCASMIWRKVWSWWNLPSPISFPSFSISDIAKGNIIVQGCPHLVKVIDGVFQITLWAIWNWRNRLIHASGDDIYLIKNDDIFPGIQRMSKLWMYARIRSDLKMDWNCWVTMPFDLFY
ncbi:RNA-directed DNA polymerase, eukaryota, reverse transcriptase zinc-binding domain protein [Tanacetum coccineum]